MIYFIFMSISRSIIFVLFISFSCGGFVKGGVGREWGGRFLGWWREGWGDGGNPGIPMISYKGG